MRKTNEGVQILTALEKAEQGLVEAIENAKRQNEHGQQVRNIEQEEIDPITQLRADVESLTDGGAEGKTLYGYAPELSRSSVIENDITEVSTEQKELLKRILGDDIFKDTEKKHWKKDDILEQIQQELHIDESLMNEEFHSGYDALAEIGRLKAALNKRTHKSVEAGIINDSEEYEMGSFDETDNFGGEVFEVADIMPSEFELYSFGDDDDETVVPYSVNEALILGDVIPPDYAEGEGPAEEPTESIIEESEEPYVLEKMEAERADFLQKTQEEAEEMLRKAEAEVDEIINRAMKDAKELVDEKVKIAEEAADQRGYDAGFERGQKDGFMAAEDAVNLGMQEEAAVFREELMASLDDFEKRKEENLYNNLNDLTELAVTIAEKVINISLKSSKNVIAQMIVAAAETCRNKEWAKIYVSHEDKASTVNIEKELGDILKQISPNVRVVVMEDEPSGTCIIESSDSIVDAGAATQLDNIRQIVKDS